MSTGSDRRRYPRMFLIGAQELTKIIGAQVCWADGTLADVLDLSYMGSALRPPKTLDLHKDQRIEFEIILKDQSPLHIVGRIVRTDATVVAVEFADLSVEARRQIGIFLSDQIIGYNLRPVNPLYFDRHQDFTSWFHGPNDTNLFIWLKDTKCDRMIFEAYNEVIYMEKNQIFVGKSRDHLELPTEDYIYNVLQDMASAPLVPGTPILNRALEIIGQARQRYPELSEVFNKLNEKRS